MRCVKLKYAMSGRPQGPYTVKKRRPVLRTLYRLWYTCASSSFSFLVAAYSDAGVSTRSASLNGYLCRVDGSSESNNE